MRNSSIGQKVTRARAHIRWQARAKAWLITNSSFTRLFIGGWFCLHTLAVRAQEPLQELLHDTGLSRFWIYKDVDRATAEAKRTGKPLLVMFRCVPCQCAAVLDKQIKGADAALELLLQNFVCVRVVQMNGVDVNRFQFDRDLSLAVLFMNADGTVYGRYGTRAVYSRTENTHISLPSFRRGAERALALHESYPTNRQQLAAKRGPEVEHRTPEAMPHLKPFPGKQQVQNCIHCHMVGEAQLRELSIQRRVTISDIWSYPLPENLGLRMVLDDGLAVKSVRPESPAARIGLQAGDELVTLAGQPIISQADIQWVLHHSPVSVHLPVQFRRDGEIIEKKFDLQSDWKQSDMYWRESLNGLRPGLNLQKLSASERQKLKLATNVMALLVRYSVDYAARAGLRPGDVIVSANNRTDLHTESEFLAYVHLARPAPSEVKLEILRKGEKREVILPLKPQVRNN